MVFASIHAEGSFDWSRSYFGLYYGLHCLREPGDQCMGRRRESGRFEVLRSNYTPTTSLVEIRGLSRGELAQVLEYALFEAELQPDDTMLVRVTTDVVHEFTIDRPSVVPAKSERSVHEFTLRRHDAQRRIIRNSSQIAGQWAISPHATECVLILHNDGSFDWTGTFEGLLKGLYQLDFEGDIAVNLTDPRCPIELISALYAPMRSRIKIKDGTDEWELEARAIDPNTIEARIDVNHSEFGRKRYSRRLYRTASDVEREESGLMEWINQEKRPVVIELVKPETPGAREDSTMIVE